MGPHPRPQVGGVDVAPGMPMANLALVPVSASSLMALIAGVVHYVVRDVDVPENLKDAFMSIKVTWVIGASTDDIINMGIKENMWMETAIVTFNQ